MCPEYLNVVEKFRDDSTKEVKDWMANERPIIEIVSQEIGLNASLINLVALGANIMHRVTIIVHSYSTGTGTVL